MGCGCNNNCDCESGITLPNQIVSALVNASNQIVFTLDNNTTITTNALSFASGNVLKNDTTQEYTQSNVQALIGAKTYTVAANQLAANGDKLVVTANVWNDTAADPLTAPDSGFVEIYINGSWYTTKLANGFPLAAGTHPYGRIEIHISRISTTSLFVDTNFNIRSSVYNTVYDGGFTDTVAVADVSANSFPIAVYGKTVTGTEKTYCDQFTVEYFKMI